VVAAGREPIGDRGPGGRSADLAAAPEARTTSRRQAPRDNGGATGTEHHAGPPEHPKRPGRYARLRHSIGRHPADLVRMAVAAGVVMGCVVAARARGVNEVEVAIFHEIQRLPGWSGRVWHVLTWAGWWPGIVAGAGLALYLGRVRMAVATAWAGVIGWLLVVLLHVLVGPRPVPEALLSGHVRGPGAEGFAFPSLHVAVVAALATAAAPYVTRAERVASSALVAAVAVADLYLGTNLPLDVFAGAVLGWGVGIFLHVVLGAPGRRTAEPSVQVALRQVGLAPVRVTKLRTRPFRPLLYRVVCADGQPLQLKVVRRLHRLAGPGHKLRRALASVEVEDEPGLSTPRHEVEHEAYINLLAERAGVGTLPVVCAGEIEHGPPFLIRRLIEGRPLSELSADEVDDAVLAEIWRNVSALGAARITHHDLQAANFLVDADRQVRITDFTFGAVGGQEGHNYEDVAEVLVSVASVVGVRRAVESALRAVPAETLREAQPHLQTLALHRRFRRQLAGRAVLVDLRETLADRLGCEVPTFRSPVRPAKVAILAAGGLAVYLLLPELAEAAAVRSAIEHADWGWLGVTVATGMLAVVVSSMTIIGAARERLPLGRTVAVQVGAAFTGRTTVAAVGYYAINMAFLERLGMRRTDAVGVLILNRAVTVVVTGIATVVGLLVIGNAVPIGQLSIPWWAIVATAVLVLAVVGFLASPFGRERVWRRVTAMLRDLWSATVPTLRKPVRCVQLIGGEVVFLALSAAGMVATLAALGAHFSVGAVVAVYIVASTLGQLLPTPGGLGAVEGALVAGLTAIGLSAPDAIAAALVTRVLTFWLPVLPGIVAFRLLQHRGVI
jgi:glycosyltransferase 2 family protein